jgi:hypothetical protein
MEKEYSSAFKRPLKYLYAKVRAWLDSTAQAKNARAMQEIAQSASEIRTEFAGIRGILNQEVSWLAQARQAVNQEITRLAQFRQEVNQEIAWLAQARQGVNQEIARLTQVRQEVNQEVTRLADVSNQTRLAVTRNHQVGFVGCTDAGQLFALFSEVKRWIGHWDRCELIFSCPATYSGALSLFPEKTVIKVEQLGDIYQSIADKKFDTVGLLSPWLLPIFEAYPESLLLLLRACRDRLLYVDGYCNGIDSARIRRTLHRAGIYEIAAPERAGGIDFSTVGCTPDGRYSYRGSEPGLPSSLYDWRTHLASRLPLLEPAESLWRSATLSPLICHGEAFGTELEELALSSTGSDEQNVVAAQINVAGTVRWKGPSRGHASLVACYAGPGDTHMYAGLLQVVEGSGVQISIWMNNGQWACLAQGQVPEGAITTEQSYFSLPLWLKVDSESVSVGSGDACLITEYNNELPRIPSVGVRIAENAISVSNISYNFL